MNDSGSEARGSWLSRRLVLLALVALIPLIPIAIGAVIITAGTGSAKSSGFTPVTARTGQSARTRSGQAASTAPQPQTPTISGALVALVLRPTAMRFTPGGRVLTQLHTRTEFGSPQVLWVVQQAPGWLGVISTLAGNGKVGWIPQSAASLSTTQWELKVSLSARQLKVIDKGVVLKRYTIAIGAPGAPTPTGRFAVTDRLATHDPTGPYGCCILALSAHSPHAIQDWSGGNRIAIHSTPDTPSIGEASSHGCMRLTLPQGQWLITHVPLGTPTLIST